MTRMSAVDRRAVEAAVAEMLRVLGPHVSRDWEAPAGSLGWTCRQAAAHIAHDLFAYAGQVAAQPGGAYLQCDLTVRPEASASSVLQVALATGQLLAEAVASAEPTSRGWHFGLTDPSGFEAMGVGEALLHTYDIACGLEVPLTLPDRLCTLVLDRLFPDAPDGDPATVLLWATGRGPLEGHSYVTEWVWKAAV